MGIIASGSVTQANAKKSLVDGAAFVDLSTELVTDGGFDLGISEWSNTINSTISWYDTSALQIRRTGVWGDHATSTVTGLSAGHYYIVSFDFVSTSTPTEAVVSLYVDEEKTCSHDTEDPVGTYSGFFTASGSSVALIFKIGGAGANVVVDNVSIQESLSPYADADSGDHKHIFKLIDSSNKVAWGYVGASGGGETTEEQITNGSFTTWTGAFPNEVPTGWDINFTPDANNYVSEDANGMLFVSDNTVATDISQDVGSVGELYHLIAVVYSGNLGKLDEGILIPTPPGDNKYYVFQSGSGFANVRRAGVVTGVLTSLSALKVTDCSTNGLHILSTKSGSVQNWAEVESGFDVNCSAGYTWEIKTIGRGASIW